MGGVYLSGALCIYHGDLSLSNSVIKDNHADDALNVKYGAVSIQKTLFENNFADNIDCDFCVGEVKNSAFIGNVNGSTNGDGLDISGSKLLIQECEFKHLGDKGVSIGEHSEAIVYKNLFDANRNLSAIKDSSRAIFLGNTFKSSSSPILSYQKKQIFQGGHVFLGPNHGVNARDLLKLDLLSTAYQLTSKGQKALSEWNPAGWKPQDLNQLTQQDYWQKDDVGNNYQAS
jgi:hypothetical protein